MGQSSGTGGRVAARLSRARSSVDPGVAGHPATVDEVTTEGGEIWMEDRETLVDLVLPVGAIVRKAAVQDHGKQELSLAGLSRDRDESTIAEEGPNDLLLLGEAAPLLVTWQVGGPT